MDELFFNNFSQVDGTNRFSVNAVTERVFSNLAFLFVWTNVYYSSCKMTPILISENRFEFRAGSQGLGCDSQKCLEPDAAEAASAQLHFQPCHATCVMLLWLKPFIYLYIWISLFLRPQIWLSLADTGIFFSFKARFVRAKSWNSSNSL